MNDKELTERIVYDLDALPGQMNALEQDLITLRENRRVSEIDVKNTELEATINAVIDGKNETQRKQQQAQAVEGSRTVKEARAKLAQAEAEIASAELNVKMLSRKFQAALALSEFQAARINLMARYQPQPKKAS